MSRLPKYTYRSVLAVGALTAVAFGVTSVNPAVPASATNRGAATRAACTLALDDYQSEIDDANKFDQIAIEYQGEILPAYKAGQAGSNAQVEAITAKLAVWNDQVSVLIAQARALNPKLKTAVEVCQLLLKAES
jgi:hypothetical protein